MLRPLTCTEALPGPEQAHVCRKIEISWNGVELVHPAKLCERSISRAAELRMLPAYFMQCDM